MGTRKSSPTKTGKSQLVLANIMDITRFLAKYLSGKRNVVISTDKSPNTGYSVSKMGIAGKPFYRIRVPDWQSYNLPLNDFEKYRIYRSGLWHESCHVRYTPDQVYTHNPAMDHDIINIIEDRRIEDLGVEEWRGYMPERIFTNAYAMTMRPYPSQMYAPNFPDSARHEAFMQLLITGQMKGKLPPSEQARVEKTVRKVEKGLKRIDKDDHPSQIYTQLAHLTRMVIKDLDLHGFTPQKAMPDPSASSWDDSFTPHRARGKLRVKVKAGMDEFFEEKKKEAKKKKRKDGQKIEPEQIIIEEIEAAKKGTAQVQEEFKKTQKVDIDPALATLIPIASAVPPESFRDQRFINRMHTSLRSWRLGRREVLGESGSRLSIPDYIKDKEKPFVTRIKTSAKGRKILIVTDFSGSMKPNEDQYKRALVSSMEVLDSIGSNLAFFGFGGEQGRGGAFFFRVKRFEEPRWTTNHSAKVAALEANYPSTPTSHAYNALEDYVRRHRPDVTITVTDGGPDNHKATKDAVKRLKKHTRMVAYGIGANAKEAKRMEALLKGFDYHRVFAVDDVQKIPNKMVKLIAPT